MTSRGAFEKVLLIGLDSAVPGRWRRYAEAGDLPAGRRLLERGAFFTACLPAFPTLTTTNWATISTGAWPGTHGITDFNPHRPADRIGASPQGFDARDVTAEFVWEAAVRAGLDSVVVNWPGGWPPRVWPPFADPQEDGRGELTLVGGAGIELNEWRIGLPGMDRRVALAAEQRFSTGPEPGATRVVLPSAGLTFGLPLAFTEAYDEVDSRVELVGRVVRRLGVPALMVTDQSGRQLAALEPGQWSENLTLKLKVNGVVVDGLLRLKLQDLDPAAGLLRLYVSDICRRTWLEEPPSLVDTSSFTGLPTPGVGWDSLGRGCIDLDTFVELTAMATSWLGDLCLKLLEKRRCDLFSVHLHAVDSFYHLCARRLDPSTNSSEEVTRYEAAERAIYRQLDDVVARMLEAAGPRAFVALVSDHGAKPGGGHIPLHEILRDAGLLTASGGDPEGAGPIDWGRTQAAPQGTCYVRVNLQGRDPDGVVAPEDRERVRDDVMRAMLGYRDEASGLCPFSLVIPGEDAADLGLWGDGIGDVVYAVREEFADEHGQALPQDLREEGSWGMRCLCLLSGDGVCAGSVVDKAISLTDVAPTVCHALGIGPPAQAQGRSLLPLVLDAERQDA